MAFSRDQPVMVAAMRLKKVTVPEGSLLMTASPMLSSVTSARSFSIQSASSIALRSIA
jgi:hypothetical protein